TGGLGACSGEAARGRVDRVQDRAARMLLLVVDSVAAAQHGVLQTERSPGEAEARSPVVLVAEAERAPALRFRRRFRVDDGVGGQVEARPMIAQLLPGLQVVIPEPEVQGEARAYLVVVLQISGDPELVRSTVKRRHADGGCRKITEHEIDQAVAG